MPGLAASPDVNQIEAPVTWKTYLMCAFASFGGMFFGYVSTPVTTDALELELTPGRTPVTSTESLVPPTSST